MYRPIAEAAVYQTRHRPNTRQAPCNLSLWRPWSSTTRSGKSRRQFRCSMTSNGPTLEGGPCSTSLGPQCSAARRLTYGILRYAPLAVALLHGASVVYLTYTISTNLYRSRAQVRPSQNTRHRSEKRGKIVPVLAALAAFSFFVAEYFAFGAALASYRAWRHEQRPASTWL